MKKRPTENVGGRRVLRAGRGQDVPQMCSSCNVEGTGCCLCLICHSETLHGSPLHPLALRVSARFPIVSPQRCLALRNEELLQPGSNSFIYFLLYDTKKMLILTIFSQQYFLLFCPFREECCRYFFFFQAHHTNDWKFNHFISQVGMNNRRRRHPAVSCSDL